MAHMTQDFEDMPSAEWPLDLSELQSATESAWATYSTLEGILDLHDRGPLSMTTTKSNLIELTGRAYALLRNLRIEGMRQLAAWEQAEQAKMERELIRLARNEIEWEEASQDREETCAACDGKGYESIGPLNLNCAACEGTGLIARKGNATPQN